MTFFLEKTEIARSLNHNGAGINGARPIQIYGTMIGGTGMSNGHVTGTPILANNRRPDSTNTNKSELLNEPLTSEDNQSVRTIIVSAFLTMHVVQACFRHTVVGLKIVLRKILENAHFIFCIKNVGIFKNVFRKITFFSNFQLFFTLLGS